MALLCDIIAGQPSEDVLDKQDESGKELGLINRDGNCSRETTKTVLWRSVSILHAKRPRSINSSHHRCNDFWTSNTCIHNTAGQDIHFVRFLFKRSNIRTRAARPNHALCDPTMCCRCRGMGIRVATYGLLAGVWREYGQKCTRADHEGVIGEEHDLVRFKGGRQRSKRDHE